MTPLTRRVLVTLFGFASAVAFVVAVLSVYERSDLDGRAVVAGAFFLFFALMVARKRKPQGDTGAV